MSCNVLIAPAVQDHVTDCRAHCHQVGVEKRKVIEPEKRFESFVAPLHILQKNGNSLFQLKL